MNIYLSAKRSKKSAKSKTKCSEMVHLRAIRIANRQFRM